MTANTLRVRLRTGQGRDHTLSLPSDLPLSLLNLEIESLTSIPVALQVLRKGFPPKPIQGSSDKCISDLGISSGDSIVVDRRGSNGVKSDGTIKSSVYPASAAGVDRKPQQSPPTKTRPWERKKKKEPHVKLATSYLVCRRMPDDNSCLFSSIAYVLSPSTAPETLRSLVAKAIETESATYTETVLGRNRLEYGQWILQPSSWGGAIELGIFAKHFRTEICSVDVQSGRVDRYGTNQDGTAKHSSRVFVLYSGIHYDALALTLDPELPRDCDQTTFTLDDEFLLGAQQLGELVRGERGYTDLGKFTVKCGSCGTRLKGQAEAREHATKTGHREFEECAE